LPLTRIPDQAPPTRRPAPTTSAPTVYQDREKPERSLRLTA
jgi:hypothetical protein